ncbi:hypothetical protein [Oscillibacter sp. MSJ-31]|uniref:hypothetical protein n=1 Tax=Oscillibacter sp. MSJ-31 TaxID=2841526 RepID=UPI001C11E544|nr:hypothetical protein [Oscillibacter sp. MSJ-31]MBU5457386.1 hypothetical protein [Oscillibacter sp. MSJ-31]
MAGVIIQRNLPAASRSFHGYGLRCEFEGDAILSAVLQQTIAFEFILLVQGITALAHLIAFSVGIFEISKRS